MTVPTFYRLQQQVISHLRTQINLHVTLLSVPHNAPPSMSSSSRWRRRGPHRTIVTNSIAPSIDFIANATVGHGSTVVKKHERSLFMERPEIIVLAESPLYHHRRHGDTMKTDKSNSWHDSFSSFYPSRGLHFASIDIMTPSPSLSNFNPNANIDDKKKSPTALLKFLEQTMADDLSRLSDVTDDNSGSNDAFPSQSKHLHQRNSVPSSSSAHAVLIARGPIPSLIAQYFLES